MYRKKEPKAHRVCFVLPKALVPTLPDRASVGTEIFLLLSLFPSHRPGMVESRQDGAIGAGQTAKFASLQWNLPPRLLLREVLFLILAVYRAVCLALGAAQRADRETATLDRMPTEIKYLILKHVDALAVPVLRHVSREWESLVRLQQKRKRQRLPPDHPHLSCGNCVCAVRYARRLTRDGHLNVLRWAVEQCGPACDPDSLVWTAVKAGHLAIVQWLVECHGCAIYDHHCMRAASHGRLTILEWFRDRGYPWDACICYFASKGGHLDVLQWAHEHDCCRDERVCFKMVKHGHSEMLQWAARVNYADGALWLIDEPVNRINLGSLG